MKVLYLTKYSRKGASSRLRSYQFFPLLEAAGWQVDVKPFFDDRYLDRLYGGQKQPLSALIGYYLRRLAVLFTVKRYDRVVIEKEVFPYFFSWPERLLSLLGVVTLVDYDDAIFHNYDLSPSRLVRRALGKKIDTVMRCSSVVMAGNQYLAGRAAAAGARTIVLQPTVIAIERYQVVPRSPDAPVVIGWIGSPSTFKYLKTLTPVFQRLVARFDVRIAVVGASESLGLGDAAVSIPWSEETEVSAINGFDIGIMPLDDTPWERGKCSYKLIQYMGCGLPVVGAPVGMNVDVIAEGVNGFFARTEDEWESRLAALVADPGLRARMGREGRRIAETRFDLKGNAATLLKLLADAKP